jgi:hypothetical protein
MHLTDIRNCLKFEATCFMARSMSTVSQKNLLDLRMSTRVVRSDGTKYINIIYNIYIYMIIIDSIKVVLKMYAHVFQ